MKYEFKFLILVKKIGMQTIGMQKFSSNIIYKCEQFKDNLEDK